jgi:hypothetical protein
MNQTIYIQQTKQSPHAFVKMPVTSIVVLPHARNGWELWINVEASDLSLGISCIFRAKL